MNCLVVDDINLVGISIRKKLISLGYDKNDVHFYHYDVNKDLNKNIDSIFNLISNKGIEFLILDRGYSMIIEEGEFIYSSQLECDNEKKINCKDLLFGTSNNGLLDKLTKQTHKLKNILIYTYDPFTSGITKTLKELKCDIENTLPQANIYTVETSTVFRKPKDLKLYPDKPSSHSNENKSQDKVKISTKKVFIEYSYLISDLIDDIVKVKNKNINSYTNPKNIDFENFVIDFNSLNLTSSLKLASVAFIHKDDNNEDYLLDFPYRSYYERLNNKIIKNNYLNLFIDKNGKYLKDKWIYYDYNFTDKEFILYNLYNNGLINKKYIKKWLPLLNSSVFHEGTKWNNNKIETRNKKKSPSIRIIFYFTSVNTLYIKGHINLTFFQETDSIYQESYIKESIIPRIKLGLKFIITKSTEYIIPKFTEQILKQSTRAAISQVMARNMSHNIGAHVMNKLIDETKLKAFDANNLSNYKGTNLNDVDNETFRQLALFNNYIKCRMDYLSDVTFGTPLMQTNKKFKEDLFNGLDKVRLLLDNISGLNDFKYEIKFLRTDYEITKEGKQEAKAPEEITNINDLSIAIPNDVLGSQAFYNIIENVIRNTAKHNQNKNQKKKKNTDNNTTVFTVNIHTQIPICKDRTKKTGEKFGIDTTETLELLDTMYMVEIYDDIPLADSEKDNKSLAEYKKEANSDITELTKINWLVYQQNKKINTTILQENHALRTHSLGIVEMEASAAYLRKMEITDINADAYDVDYNPKRNLSKTLKLPILKPINVKDCLGYRFFVHKPQEVLLVGNFDLGDKKEKLLQDGIWHRTKDDFEKELIAGKTYNHQFVLYNDANIEDIIKEHKTALSIRTIKVDGKKIEQLKLSSYTNFQYIEVLVWDWWNELINKEIRFVQPNDTTNPNNSFRIYLMDHLKIGLWKKANDNNIDYIEPLSSLAQKKLPNNNFDSYSAYLNKGLNYHKTEELFRRDHPHFSFEQTTINRNKIIEAAYNKILVIDERIQEYSKTIEAQGIVEDKEEKITIHDIFNKTNIVLPDDSLNLAATNFDTTINDGIDKFIKDNIESCKFLLIHYSILERMNQDKIDTTLQEWQNINPDINIVITSGRGKPKGLPKYVRFVNLSPVLSAFSEIKSKYLIYNLLISSR